MYSLQWTYGVFNWEDRPIVYALYTRVDELLCHYCNRGVFSVQATSLCSISHSLGLIDCQILIPAGTQNGAAYPLARVWFVNQGAITTSMGNSWIRWLQARWTSGRGQARTLSRSWWVSGFPFSLKNTTFTTVAVKCFWRKVLSLFSCPASAGMQVTPKSTPPADAIFVVLSN